MPFNPYGDGVYNAGLYGASALYGQMGLQMPQQMFGGMQQRNPFQQLQQQQQPQQQQPPGGATFGQSGPFDANQYPLTAPPMTPEQQQQQQYGQRYQQDIQGDPNSGMGQSMGGYGGYGGVPPGFPYGQANALANQYNRSYGQAKLANEVRYGQILGGYNQQIGLAGQQMQRLMGGYGQQFKQGLGILSGMGQAAAGAIGRRATQQNAANTQGLINSGLGNSTVGASLAKGVQGQADIAYGQLGQDLRGQALGLQGQYGMGMLGAQQQYGQYIGGLQGQRLGFMERRNDTYPNPQNYQQVMQGVGQGYGGYQNAAALQQQRMYGGYG